MLTADKQRMSNGLDNSLSQTVGTAPHARLLMNLLEKKNKKMFRDVNNHKVFMFREIRLGIKTHKNIWQIQLARGRAACSPMCLWAEQVIPVYEAQYLFPKLQGALLFTGKTVPEGQGEGRPSFARTSTIIFK